jgi:putative zinc finger/helix-turn-helix YgiT family protein
MRACPRCGSKELTTSVEARPYTEGGLPHVVFANVEVRRCGSCGNEALVLSNIDGLHRAIARTLVRKPARLSGSEIRFLRKYLGVSSATFADLLGTTDEIVLAWEGSAQRLPIRTEIAIRVLVAARQPVTSYPVEKITQAVNDRGAPVAAKIRMRKTDGTWRADSSLHS